MNGLIYLTIFYDGSREWYENNLLYNELRNKNLLLMTAVIYSDYKE